ncbi:Uncharacterised protein [Legionella busanensis]|uniref:Uncharacterized protein n=1 Tax=Legionella busanensis TaxID=190655 RepID=A0A378JTW4_9GAMM|nr:hypothetical protein [Legionella busanensis]STX51632.1 Uncharacterised protein [Legionella busanensis]
MTTKVTFNDLLSVVKEPGDVLVLSRKLKISVKRLYGFLGLLGTDIAGLAELDDDSKDKLQQFLGNNDLSDYLLKIKDFDLISKEKAEELLEFNKNTIAGIFSTDVTTIIDKLNKKGIILSLFSNKHLKAEDYGKVQGFINDVLKLRKQVTKQRLEQFFDNLAMLDFTDSDKVNAWVKEITPFLKSHSEEKPVRRIIDACLIPYNDYLYQLLLRVAEMRTTNSYLIEFCSLYKAQDRSQENNSEIDFSVSNIPIDLEPSEQVHSTKLPEHQLTGLYIEQLTSLQGKLIFLLQRLSDIQANEEQLLSFWSQDISGVLNTSFGSEWESAEDITVILQRTTHTPTDYNYKLLSNLIKGEPDNRFLAIFLKSYKHFMLIKKGSNENYESWYSFFSPHNSQNYSSDLAQGIEISEQNSDLRNVTTKKPRHSDAFFITPANHNFLSVSLEALARKFLQINFLNPESGKILQEWVQELENLLGLFEKENGKLDVKILVQALPNSFDDLGFRSKLRLVTCNFDNPYFNLFMDAIEVKYRPYEDILLPG